MITEIEQYTIDFDWFFANCENIGFVASAGGKLPLSVSKSKTNLQILSLYFSNLPVASDVIINPRLTEFIRGRVVDDRYLDYFVEMTEKGLFSFDKTFDNKFSDPNYHLVASPVTLYN